MSLIQASKKKKGSYYASCTLCLCCNHYNEPQCVYVSYVRGCITANTHSPAEIHTPVLCEVFFLLCALTLGRLTWFPQRFSPQCASVSHSGDQHQPLPNSVLTFWFCFLLLQQTDSCCSCQFLIFITAQKHT